MAKKKVVFSSVPDISKEMSFCISNGIKVYPVDKKGKWYIESEINGVVKFFKKEIRNDEIGDAMAKTYLYYYEKLKIK